MSGVTSHLYPPIIATYQPAFIYTKSCRVYFSISQYNTFNDIKTNAQIKIVNQNNNAMALDSTLYPVGIKITGVNIDEKRMGDDKYYIEIFPSDMQNGFQLNQYYKIQIRFTDKSAPHPFSTAIDQWLTTNIAYFSEWSTITLVKAISEPTVKLTSFEDSDNLITLNTELPAFVGRVNFQDELDDETLRSYQIKLYKDKVLVVDTDIIYSNIYGDPNEIYYILQYILEDGNFYTLEVTITTRNYYTETFVYDFIVILNNYYRLRAYINATPEEELGSIVINVTGETNEPFIDNITIRRSSSRSDFTIWEDVHTEFLSMDKGLDLVWVDHSVESGIWYQYCAQRRGADGSRGIVSAYSNQTCVLLDDMFLSAGGKHLRIRYNPIVSSYKRNVSESKTDTIGSKYPFIKRNGYVNYKQFSISGLITIYMDEDDLFTSREELLGNPNSLALYNFYNDEHRISNINDQVWEREFREKVMNFLYADDVKLFRTNTEGNILVKLMDINLTPEQTLGRQIYSFSATAYEIDEFTLDNLSKYGVQTIGTYNTVASIDFNKQVYGQIDMVVLANKDVISDILSEKYQNLIDTETDTQSFDVAVGAIKYLRIEFNDKPYLISSSGGTLRKLDEEVPTKDTLLGYIVYINNSPMYVSTFGKYELKGNDVNITSLSFPTDSNVTIDYLIDINITDISSSTQVSVLYIDSKIGQLWGTFSYEDSIIQKLWKKYIADTSDYYQKLSSLEYVQIEADEGVVIYIKTSQDTSIKRYMMNSSNILKITDDNFIIDGLYFSGIHVEPATADELLRDQVPANKYVNTGITVDSVDDIKNPIYNGVYTIRNFDSFAATVQKYKQLAVIDESQSAEARRFAADRMFTSLIYGIISTTNKYIYHDGKFQIFDVVNNDILCSVEALIDYVVEIERGVY